MKNLILLISLLSYGISFAQHELAAIITTEGDSITFPFRSGRIKQKDKVYFYYSQMPSDEELKPSVGFSNLIKLNKKYGRTISINKIDKIISQGILTTNNSNSRIKIPVEYGKIVKIKNKFTFAYVLTEGYYSLYLCPNCGQNEFIQYYIKHKSEKEKKVHATGAVLSANYWTRLSKLFYDCPETLNLISSLRKNESKMYVIHEQLIAVIDSYNNNCAK